MSSRHRTTPSRVLVRPLRIEDFDKLVELQLACFPGMKPWQRDHIESQISVFPEGQIAVEVDGELVASSASLIVDYADYAAWHDWLSIAGGGYIKNHDPDGDTLYGIEIMVHPKMQGKRLARRLYEARKEICREKNLARMMAGGRIPGYAGHKNAMSAQDYVRRVVARELVDPVLTAQLANDFVLRQLIPDYLPSDEDSAGYATWLEWPNLDYRPGPRTRARRAVDTVRVASVQYPMRRVTSFEDFAQQVEFFVDCAADQRADFVLFPELFTLQLLSIVEEHAAGRAARALAELTPRYVELFGQLALRYDTNIIGGSQFVVEDERLLNASYLFHRDGRIDRQKKIHVTPNEQRFWGIEGGRSVEVFETDRGKIAILICYDVEFPELARLAAGRGAEILFVPFNTNDRRGHLRVRTCAMARAIENQLYVVTSGCVGSLPQVENADIHYAQSGIFTPSDIGFARDGVACDSAPNVETVLLEELDLEVARRSRRMGTVRPFSDRRTDLYRVRSLEGDEPHEV